LLLHFVGKLVFREVRGNEFEGSIEPENDNHRKGNRFEPASAMLAASAGTPLTVNLEHENISPWLSAHKQGSACEKWLNRSYFYAITAGE
jgi:hypothetical protein